MRALLAPAAYEHQDASIFTFSCSVIILSNGHAQKALVTNDRH